MKNDLRILAKNKRKLMENKEKLDSLIRENVLKNEMVLKCQNILIYVSLPREIDTIKIIKSLFNMNKNVYVPRVKDNNMDFYLIRDLSELKKGSFGILEPLGNQKINNFNNACIIVPGLIFDKNNYRLGYGGGYYDRYLACKNIYKIGLVYKDFIIDKLDVQEYDIPVNEVITE